MYRLIGFFVCILALSGCATKYSVPEDAKIINANELSPLPSYLKIECENYTKYLTSDIESIIITHSENMEKAIICKDRHNTLIKILKERKLWWMILKVFNMKVTTCKNETECWKVIDNKIGGVSSSSPDCKA